MQEYRFKINGHDYDVIVNDVKGTTADVTVNGTEYDVDILTDGSWLRQVCPPSDTLEGGVQPTGWEGCSERSERNLSAAKLPSDRMSAAAGSPKTTKVKVVKAPLPGVILNMKVGRGQEVKKGDKIAVLEAMKMENDILAPIDGIVTNVFVSKGDAVLEGAKIAEIE